MSSPLDHRSDRAALARVPALCAAALAIALLLVPVSLAVPATAAAARAPRSPYPAAATRPVLVPRASEFAGARAPARARAGESTANANSAGHTVARAGTAAIRGKKKSAKGLLHGNPARALLAYEAMQQRYYLEGSGLYAGEPFSYLWPFSQALAATVSMANVNIPGMSATFERELQARLVGLNVYLDTNNSDASEGAFTSTLPAFDGTAAPPVGPGGAKYYDDNDWVGIELARLYEKTHSAPVLGSAEAIMAFEMAGWQTSPQLACPGGIPFSNAVENSERNTVTTAPATELALQLYRITANVQYLQFAEMAYQWVHSCMLESNGMYADHISPKGVVEPMLWSYNQGSMIGAGTLLYQVTGNGAYLYQARQTAAAALAYFTPERLASENPFFPSVYFRNLLYLDSVTGDPAGPPMAQAYVNYAWQHLRLSDNVFVGGSPASAQLLVQAAIVQIYALLSSPASTYF